LAGPLVHPSGPNIHPCKPGKNARMLVNMAPKNKLHKISFA
jgi:hypothetical protein